MALVDSGSRQSANGQGVETTDTIIVGAGPSGLSIAACLTKLQIPFILLERSAALGAAWRNHYERLHLHTVKKHSSLPYLPFADDVPKYVPREKVVEYLDRYAAHFGLVPRLNENITSVRPQAGGWETKSEKSLFYSSRVIIASGYNRKPVFPKLPDQASFVGPVIHSANYRTAKSFAEKRVLVVGFGNTGAEIALDLIEHGASVTLSVRGPVHVVPREVLGTPTQVTGIVLECLPRTIAGLLSNVMTRLAVGDLSRYGIHRPSLSPFQQVNALGRVPVIDIGTIKKIKQGIIKVSPDIAKFGKDSVQFVDGTESYFDAVIVATGYRPGLDEFLEDAEQLVDERGYPLELSRESKRYPGLYFLGFKNPPSGFLRQIAIDAQDIAKDIAAKRNRQETALHAKP